ncbi:hypothetical protein NBRC116590_25480 [Pelagimonas sp. KU-00592-HH]
MKGWLQAHFKGRQGMLALLCNTIGLSLAATLLSHHLGLLYAVAVTGALGLLAFWQVIGAFRFGDRHARDNHMGLAWLGYGSITIVLALLLVTLPGLWLEKPAVDLTPHDTRVRVEAHDDHLLITGQIDYRTLSQLRTALADHPALPVWLNSGGGHVIAARVIATVIEAEQRDTHVPERCLSACTMVLAGGTHRSAAPDAVIGFHSYRFDHDMRVETLNVAEQEAKDQAYLIARGIDPAFVRRIYETPPDKMWHPTRQEMQAAGVLSDPE